MSQRIAGLLAAVLLALGPGAGYAEEGVDQDTAPLWEWFVAGFARYGPVYPGASEYQFNFVPLPFPRYRGRFLRVGEDTENPLRGRVFRRDRIKLDIDFDLNFGSDSEDVDVREGLPDLDFVLEAGPELSLQFVGTDDTRWRAFLKLPLRAAFSWPGFDPRYRGLVFSPEIRFQRRYSDYIRDEVSLRITPSFATSEYMDYFYGVPPQFATPARPAFDARAGYRGTETGLTLRKKLAERWEAVAGVRLDFLYGARNRNSPLFEDDVNASVFVAFLWKFWESKTRVPVVE